MAEVKVFVPFGALGIGIEDDAFRRGMEMGPDIISVDAGSTDSGPYYLGTGSCKYAHDVIRRDVEQIMVAAHAAGIPITIGSAGTCGTDNGVDELAAICDEVAKKHGFQKKIARIYTQMDPQVLKERYHAGGILPLQGAPEIGPETFDSCSNIVGLAGAEPFMEALEAGADIVICGRATDTAVIAAYPLLKGCRPAASWHAAKTAECGCLCTTNPHGGGVFLTIDDHGFTVAATATNSSCTPYSVSAHLLYENADPLRLVEPGIVVDTSGAVYTQLEDGRVRVEGTASQRLPYTIKLEGSAPAGYQTVSFVGLQDRDIMKDPEMWIRKLEAEAISKMERMKLPMDQFHYSFKIYGYNAVTGTAVPAGYVPNEVGVMLVVTAKSQDLATRVAKCFNPLLLHCSIFPDRLMPSFAFPFSPAEIQRGLIYAFQLYHVVKVESPMELFRIAYGTAGKEDA